MGKDLGETNALNHTQEGACKTMYRTKDESPCKICTAPVNYSTSIQDSQMSEQKFSI